MNKALSDQSIVIKINGFTLKNFRNTEDMVLNAETSEDFEASVTIIVDLPKHTSKFHSSYSELLDLLDRHEMFEKMSRFYRKNLTVY